MSRVLRGLGLAVAGLVVLLIVAAAAVYGLSQRRLHRTYRIAVDSLAIPADSGTLLRGRALVTGRLGCAECHGADLGGQVVTDNPAFGRYVAANLTAGRGGVARRYRTDGDWVRLLRHGVRPDGSPVMFMPVADYAALSAEDLAAVVAYLKQVPAVDRELAESRMGPVARVLVVTNKAPLIPAERLQNPAPFTPEPVRGPTAEYGEYLVNTGGCRGCHGPALAGGHFDGPPSAPAAANLTPGGTAARWTEAEFIRALRTGTRPDGSHIDPFMPWKAIGSMPDDELLAVYRYLHSIPAAADGAN